MPVLNPILETEIIRIIDNKSPLTDKPTVIGAVSFVGGILSDRITHLIAFHVEGWGLNRWANFTFNIAGPDPLNMSVQNLTYREDLRVPGTEVWDEDDLTALASKLLYV
ncbi:hypothetical protein CcrC1_gp302 [Caulobacter phage C1]|nr:hypothetical protein CcrC1_gp302 [Caulobacter phage C1]UTU08531.1 hypothetical protein CcrC2_gp303 [Caulobacter phage C2]UTU09047.1 hypothetical protein CcrJ4_gp298 [Caulobacter phage J4]UTU09607.1 hypothetical protein CcrBL47_gp321 [Caulobacter phage BL47]UTU10164.1 hypothetical protein CcrRB23_gp302 [Caulobacter phage RB23]WGN97198.1 hypothetical protein [Bertelyvirus sp.]